ncbi:MFS transporter [Actinacidiphila glaucinigra]|uniref:MFS transporter n=1 Tax=Actinacidiphila glaucinigra TaxID=235986 RepID=UPI002E31AB98|nr:MFS transporter [Actinacidiphila glaucinigra]
MTAPAIAAPPLSPSRAPAHRDANVLRWLAAFTASIVGDAVWFLALSWAATRAGDPGRAGLVLAAGSVPRAALMLGGGVLADRFGPRRIVIGSDLTRCAVMFAAAALLALTTPGLWALAVVALLFGAVDAVFLPAVGALPARITGPDQLGRLHGMKGIAMRVGNVAGASLGGTAVAAGGAPVAFAAAGVLFSVSLVLLVAVRVAPLPPDDRAAQADGTAWRDLVEGLRHIRARRVLTALMAVIAIGELGFAGPFNIGLALVAADRGWGAAGLGWIVSGFGAGAGAASLLLTVRGRLPRAGLAQACCLGLAAVAVAAFAFVPALPGAVALAVVVGLVAGLSGALCGALLQTLTDPAYLGRVSSVAALFSLGLAPMSYPLTGAAIGAWGPQPVFVASAAVAAAGAVLGIAAPALRRAELARRPG